MAKARVAIIGAGLGGLCAAVKLKEAGFTDIVILEKADSVGGVWRDNQYPGCACDTPVALYQFSFFPSIRWSHLYPRAPEVRQYADDMADMFGLRAYLKLNDEAVSAVWDDARRVWTVRTANGASYEAEILVPALGQLSRPMLPEIAGRNDFAGPSWHSARWRHDVDLAGKRVACIGSAASAVQLIPEVAKIAGHLSVFQRTPNWVISRLDRSISDEEKMLFLSDIEAAARIGGLNRQFIFEQADYFFWQAFQWTEAGRAAFTRQALDKLARDIPDEVLRKKLTPDYPIGCKRILITDDFLPAMTRENVSLITEGIEAITPQGIRTRDGVEHGVDAIIYATGFETTGWHWSLDVAGANRLRLNDVWEDEPEAYLGITASGFPNMFMLYGPNTNLGHNTITAMIEAQVRYLVEAALAMEARNIAAMAPTKDAQSRFNAELQSKLANTVWADPGCGSWYKTADGRITQNWSGPVRAYTEATQAVRWEDYDVVAKA